MLGKADGTSKGMGGSMHLYGEDVGFMGSVPLVGATIPLAVGAGLAAKLDGRGAIGVTYFGDGATEEGVFHESMNLAATFSLPVLFVCENNLFSSHLYITQRQPSDRIARYGEAHRMATVTIDGNDVAGVARTTAALIKDIRAGKGPALIEAITYRHRGHVGPKDDIDVGVQRSVADVNRWKQARSHRTPGRGSRRRWRVFAIRLRGDRAAGARGSAGSIGARAGRSLSRRVRTARHGLRRGIPMTARPATGYGDAIREGFEYLLGRYPNVFTIGQGLWSPWYVGNSMTDLDKKFGRERVIDTPVSELASTGAAIGASLCGYRPIVIHPRMDFMILAADQIINQAAKWSHMLGRQASPAVTVRAIINRGGEQGAQHSQSLHSWFAHIPGLRVVMPSTAADARDLLISSVLCDDPVMYIDDRWLYERSEVLPDVVERPLSKEGPVIRTRGSDVTLVGSGFSAYMCEQAAAELEKQGIRAEAIDVRVLNPFDATVIIESVARTRRLVVVDGGWRTARASRAK